MPPEGSLHDADMVPDAVAAAAAAVEVAAAGPTPAPDGFRTSAVTVVGAVATPPTVNARAHALSCTDGGPIAMARATLAQVHASEQSRALAAELLAASESPEAIEALTTAAKQRWGTSATVRDAVGMGVESSGDLVMGMNHVPSRNSLYALRVVETRANLLRAGTMLDQAALDKYSFTRDAYLQRRDSQVRDLIGRGKDAEDE